MEKLFPTQTGSLLEESFLIIKPVFGGIPLQYRDACPYCFQSTSILYVNQYAKSLFCLCAATWSCCVLFMHINNCHNIQLSDKIAVFYAIFSLPEKSLSRTNRWSGECFSFRS